MWPTRQNHKLNRAHKSQNSSQQSFATVFPSLSKASLSYFLPIGLQSEIHFDLTSLEDVAVLHSMVHESISLGVLRLLWLCLLLCLRVRQFYWIHFSSSQLGWLVRFQVLSYGGFPFRWD
ncbi:hypothetical protein QYF36_010340 [Acer negundo]|nr:hypothetical protein QYF36_010340 [Acer negundo]